MPTPAFFAEPSSARPNGPLDCRLVPCYQITMLVPRPTTFLRWSLSAVLGIQAVSLLYDHAIQRLTAVTLAVLELAAVVLFLLPRTVFLGAILLIGVLVCASAVHLSLKQAPSLAFVVYAAAIWVVVQDARKTRPAGGSSR